MGRTVWRIVKSPESQHNILKIINSLEDSGFLYAFTPGGYIETNLMEELHKSFTSQFRDGEIENIISTIKKADPGKSKERTIEVLKRIAVKALMFDLLSKVSNEIGVNHIEHFYRRGTSFGYWTGDIWTTNNDGEAYLVLTPRCDIASGKAKSALLCKIEKHVNFPEKGDVKERLRKHLIDNIEAKAKRYIPQSPFFAGGMVNLAEHITIPNEELKKSFTYNVTLSDDLTNEILGKFAYYFLRTGISTMNVDEYQSYLGILK